MSTILVADDDPRVRALVCEMLTRSGYRAQGTETGTQALADMHRADLLLCDLVMPETDGLDVLRTARERTDAPPIIIMSGSFDTLDALPEAARLGAADALAKPFTAKTLIARVRRALAADPRRD